MILYATRVGSEGVLAAVSADGRVRQVLKLTTVMFGHLPGPQAADGAVYRQVGWQERTKWDETLC